MSLVRLGTAACSAAIFALLAGAPASAQQPAPEDIEEHETQPQDQYEPSLDVMKDESMEAPGEKPGVPSLTEQEFAKANQIYFSAAPAATACSARAQRARR